MYTHIFLHVLYLFIKCSSLFCIFQTLPTTTYELEIVAKDMAGSEVGLTGTATATITITDKNDHAPEFTHPLVRNIPFFSLSTFFNVLNGAFSFKSCSFNPLLSKPPQTGQSSGSGSIKTDIYTVFLQRSHIMFTSSFRRYFRCLLEDVYMI